MRKSFVRPRPYRSMGVYSCFGLIGLSIGWSLLASSNQARAHAWSQNDLAHQDLWEDVSIPPLAVAEPISQWPIVLAEGAVTGEGLDDVDATIEILSATLDAARTIASDKPKVILLSDIVTEVRTLALFLNALPDALPDGSSEASPDVLMRQTDLSRLLETAFESTQAMSDPILTAKVLGQIGHAHAVLGNQQQAMTVLDNATAMVSLIGIAEQTGDRVKALTAIASGYGVLDQEPQAGALMQEAHATTQQLTEQWDEWLYAYALLDIAQAQIHMGQSQAATETLLLVNQAFASEWVIIRDAIAIVQQLEDESQTALVLKEILSNSNGVDTQVLDSIVKTIAELENQALAIALLDAVIQKEAQGQWSSFRMDTPTVETIATILMELDDQQQALMLLNRLLPSAPTTTHDPLQSVYFINLEHVAAIAPVYEHLEQSQILTDRLLTMATAWGVTYQKFQGDGENPDLGNIWARFYLYHPQQIDALRQVDAIARDHLTSPQYATVATAVMSGLETALADLMTQSSAQATNPPNPPFNNWALKEIASIYLQMEQWQRASELLGMLFDHLDELDENDRDIFLSAIVSAYGELEDEQVAIEGLERALAINTFRSLDRQLALLSTVALSYGQLGQFQRMDTVLNDITRQLHNLDEPSKLWLLLMMADIRNYFDDRSGATALLEQARTMYLSLKEVEPEITPQYEWHFLKELTVAYNDLRDTQTTGSLVQEALALTPALNVPKSDDALDEPWRFAAFDAAKLLREIIQTVDSIEDDHIQHDLKLAIISEASTLVDDMDKAQLLTHVLQMAVSQDGTQNEG